MVLGIVRRVKNPAAWLKGLLDCCGSLDSWSYVGAAEGACRGTVSWVDERAEHVIAVAVVL